MHSIAQFNDSQPANQPTNQPANEPTNLSTNKSRTKKSTKDSCNDKKQVGAGTNCDPLSHLLIQSIKPFQAY